MNFFCGEDVLNVFVAHRGYALAVIVADIWVFAGMQRVALLVADAVRQAVIAGRAFGCLTVGAGVYLICVAVRVAVRLYRTFYAAPYGLVAALHAVDIIDAVNSAVRNGGVEAAIRAIRTVTVK